MKVSLKIKTFENQKELLDKIVKALKKIEREYISYIYVDEFGKNIIKIFKDSVIIERSGQVKSTVLLKKNCETDLEYKNQYLDMRLTIFTKKLDIHNEGFKTEYTIYQGKEIINKIIISMEELS
ncbi:DUF1934 family protein [Fusobacterium sp.]|uniref:DUF1934 family protein n=1 Tax=Fusobacterium sp. TaxID=68766 RepID=UPI002638FA6E|nr:DUF1934 family protein [Fusobacterium sp.]